MRLKKLEIFGFKSFADKTTVEFNEGITGVVGPNGCGKSNIVDAFRWVLGEQSAKSMRGQKMHDVIFAGTSKRKPLNFAEVTLTLTDVDGALPVEYSEVAITRRLHRSGESEYLLNRNPVRLKDVQGLFLDSGIGKNAFSIFEQGKIDQVINLAPLERRYIFEEAAGILRFLQRKREALRKLEQTDGNMTRIKDIHREVEKQIEVLEKQAEKARVYKENKVRLETLEKAVLVAKWDDLDLKCREVAGKEIEQGTAIKDLNAALVALQNEFSISKRDVVDEEKALQAKKEAVFKARSEREIRIKEGQTNEERLKEAVERKKVLEGELKVLLGKRKAELAESLDNEMHKQELQGQVEEMEQTVKANRKTVAGLEATLSKLRERQSATQKEQMILIQQNHELASKIKEDTVRLDNSQEKIVQLERRKEELAQHQAKLAATIEERREAVRQASQNVDDRKEKFEALERKLGDLSEEMLAAQEQVELILQEVTDGKARHKVLLRLRQEMEGFSSGTKRLLQESADAKSPLCGKVKPLYEMIAGADGEEKALAAVLRPYVQTLVVEKEDDFKKIIDFAKQSALNDFSLLCLEKLATASAEPVKEKGFEPLFISLLQSQCASHFLQKIYLVDGVDQGLSLLKKHAGAHVWTRDGVYIDDRQVLFVMGQGENNVFLREAEIQTLEKVLKKKEELLKGLRDGVQAIERKRAILQAERLELDKHIRQGEMKLVEVNFALQQTNGELKVSLVDSKKVEEELLLSIEAIRKLKTALNEMIYKQQCMQEKVAQAEDLVRSLEQEVDKHTASWKDEQRVQREKETAYQVVLDKYQKRVHALSVLQVKDQQHQEQEKKLEAELAVNGELQSKIQGKHSNHEQALAEVEQILSQVVKAHGEFEEAVTEKKGKIEQVDLKLAEMREQQKKAEEKSAQSQVQLAQHDSKRQAVEGELQERYQLTLADARSLGCMIDQSIAQSEKVIRSLRQEIEQAGDVNMTSIDEFEKNKVRYSFLNQQIDDLNVSKSELMEIITKLDGESRTIFKETFEKVRANFQKNFQILFTGGEADLTFTDATDILEAGIDIVAKPPGKQMRSINLMSGGEKCLTAMALLFALFEVKPAPFCILDEIDAPLDDTNVDRFLGVVKHYIDVCQFVIITHNKRSMSIADRLFGVSMEERGVSKLLSMEFATSREPVLV